MRDAAAQRPEDTASWQRVQYQPPMHRSNAWQAVDLTWWAAMGSAKQRPMAKARQRLVPVTLRLQREQASGQLTLPLAGALAGAGPELITTV